MRTALLPVLSLLACQGAKAPAPAKLPTETNSVGMAFVRLPGGEFAMGDAEHRKPVHRVRVSPFAMGATEVTNRQYDALVKGHKRPAESKGDKMPVTGVTYKDAARYAALLSKKEGKRYRLPTDAEWEYAARGGLEGKQFPWGDDPGTMPANSGIRGLRPGCEPVGSYPPNAYGLYDMVGNAEEWVQDGADEFGPAVARRVDVDPMYRGDGTGNLVRGGSFSDWYPFVWFRLHGSDHVPGEILVGTGFRLVLNGAALSPKRAGR